MKKLWMFSLVLLNISCLVCIGQDKIDLSGEWQFALDSLERGEAEEWFNKELLFQIKLPGSVDEANYGIRHIPGTPLYNDKSEIWRLARKCHYIGKAWYRKTVNIPKNWQAKNIVLFLERSMWQTKVWINGEYVSENHSLCVPHRFEICDLLKPGKNTISLQVNNAPYVNLGSWSHGYSPEMQSIWNGVVGKIELIARSKVNIGNIQLYPSFKKQSLIIKGSVNVPDGNTVKGHLNFIITDDTNNEVIVIDKVVSIGKEDSIFETTINLENKLLPWDEFHPNLYTLEIKSKFGESEDYHRLVFGIRDIEAVDGRFLVNGKKSFMRGELDGGSAPLTGYAPMDKNEWLRIFRIGKKHGLNHWRFHSWCPAEAAFEAADELGVYLQPELTLFSQVWEGTIVGNDESRDEFLFEELRQLLDTYGNHPSFMFMCMGNELKGDYKVLEKWVDWGKRHDPRHLYVSNANLEAMGIYKRLNGDDFQVAHGGLYKGKSVRRRMFQYYNNEIPNTQKDYSHTLLPPFDKWPIISHEVGQWLVYPDFSEIEKYKGIWDPRNLKVFRGRLERKGMLEQADEFMKASGKLSALLYREEMERLLRTPGMGGYQLLGLRDYQAQGSALIGMLNAFWESKGIISAEEFCQSNNDVTLLLKMPKRVWQNNETFEAELVVPNYSSGKLKDLNIEWSVLQDGEEIDSGLINKAMVNQGDVVSVGNISFCLNNIKEASELNIHLYAPEMDLENNYDIWIYPDELKCAEKDVIIATESTLELLRKIERGATALLVPKDDYDKERMTFTTPFWSTILFDYQIKTMGLLCDPKHPVFKYFPTDFHTNWQWWELIHNSYAVRLNHTENSYLPLLQVIDHAVRNDKLGALLETKIGKGKLLVSTLDILSELGKRPVARQLRYSILKYMQSEDFNPKKEIGVINAFFNNTHDSKIKYKKITSNNENSEYPIFYAFDDDEKTYWQSVVKNSEKITIELELEKSRYITGCRLILGKNCSLGHFSVRISDDRNNMGDIVITGDGNSTFEYNAITWDNGFTKQIGKKGRFIKIEIEPEQQGTLLKMKEWKWILGD